MATGPRTVAENVKLTLGLVGTTGDLKPRRRTEKVDSFRTICPVDAANNVGTAVKQKYFCPDHPDTPFDLKDCAKGKEIVKATKTRKGEIIPLSDAEVEQIRQIEEATGKTMPLAFHPAGQVSLVPTGISYALIPEGNKPDPFYGILASQLAMPGRVCLGRMVLRGREKIFLVSVASTGLIVSEMCRPEDVYELPVTATDAEAKYLDFAKQLIDAATTDFDPEEYRDHTAERLDQVLAAKANGEATVTTITPRKAEPEVDLLAAMEASLAALKAGKEEAA